MKRIYFLYTHPIQYFSPLQKKIEASGVCRSIVLYCEDTTSGYYDTEFGKKINWDIPLLSGYTHKFIANSGWARLGGFFRYSNWGIRRELHKDKCDILVVHGWSYATAIFAIIIARSRGIKVWLRGENPHNQEVQKSFINRLFKKVLLQYLLFPMVDQFLYIGTQNRKFYESYGVKSSHFIFFPYCVDNERFRNDKKRVADKPVLKRDAGIDPETIVFLFCGKLINKKNPMDLLQAFHKASQPGTALVFVGDGELYEELTNYARKYAMGKVLFPGFRNQTEVADFYLMADVFVLPSGTGETWGLVVNEAMNYQLALIVSDRVGSAVDLVRVGVNGYTFPVGDTRALAQLIKTIATDKEWMQVAGTASGEIVQLYSYDTIINNLRNALQV
jgi:glycosyltransferase involved in cell wall biosynthesis